MGRWRVGIKVVPGPSDRQNQLGTPLHTVKTIALYAGTVARSSKAAHLE